MSGVLGSPEKEEKTGKEEKRGRRKKKKEEGVDNFFLKLNLKMKKNSSSHLYL